MNAIKFIKEHGIEKAREVVAAYHGIPSYTFKEKTCCGYSACQSVDLSELKRLVESVGMVKDHGGLETIRKCVEKTIFPLSDRIIRMKKAIADYESIYCKCDILGHPEDYTSPNCKKYDERVK